MNVPLQTPAVLTALKETDARRERALGLWVRITNADGGAFFPVDLMTNGAVKRLVSQSAALRLLVESWNMVCARALLRMQIDTTLRFYAIWLVDKPHDFAHRILKGERIDKMKDRDGQRLRDAYLVSKLLPAHPWLRDVYENLSGYIHFSGAHLLSSLQLGDTQNREISIVISEADDNFPEDSWLEVVQCFNAATDIFLELLMGWLQTKSAGDRQ